jgi:hypothetical protein
MVGVNCPITFCCRYFDFSKQKYVELHVYSHHFKLNFFLLMFQGHTETFHRFPDLVQSL